MFDLNALFSLINQRRDFLFRNFKIEFESDFDESMIEDNIYDNIINNVNVFEFNLFFV